MLVLEVLSATQAVEAHRTVRCRLCRRLVWAGAGAHPLSTESRRQAKQKTLSSPVQPRRNSQGQLVGERPKFPSKAEGQ